MSINSVSFESSQHNDRASGNFAFIMFKIIFIVNEVTVFKHLSIVMCFVAIMCPCANYMYCGFDITYFLAKQKLVQ